MSNQTTVDIMWILLAGFYVLTLVQGWIIKSFQDSAAENLATARENFELAKKWQMLYQQNGTWVKDLKKESTYVN